MDRHDRDKDRIVSRYVTLDLESEVLDIGCAAGTFLLRVHSRYGARATGVDFKDLSQSPGMDRIEFHCSPFYRRLFAGRQFDLITMWHFLEHDYDPLGTLETCRQLLKPGGRLVIEVPRLDSVSFRLFRNRWPGLQAPQHTTLLDREALLRMVEAAGWDVDEYLPYGAFPPYFYLFAGVAFKLLRGRGLNLGRAIYPYALGQVFLSPLLLFSRRLNLAMQTVICRRPA
jgi:2-polyprenyl-3-methyl-5-hydroxy-6-metoxy-1,4-benzoquinol methylase